jgi:hypothetical protein
MIASKIADNQLQRSRALLRDAAALDNSPAACYVAEIPKSHMLPTDMQEKNQ